MAKRKEIRKTYKLYINGRFPRSESGRTYEWCAPESGHVVNVCRGSRKDFRDAVGSARKAFPLWRSRTAYNRGQILYRVAEMLETRHQQFVDELTLQGSSKRQSRNEVDTAVDRLIYYAGWADKYQQIFSSVNPVAVPYFNFTVPESVGVVSAICPESSSLLGLVSVMAPVIIGGNSCVLLASQSKPLSAVTFAEVLHSSDVPPGVVNIMTEFRSELLEHFASHMDVDAIIYCGGDESEIERVEAEAAVNVKRVTVLNEKEFQKESSQGPYHILRTQEFKTTWHPVGV